VNRPAAGGWFVRLQSAIPLLVVYFALAALYAWQASRRPVPTIFTDELELTQLSRAIAETGEPARRGVPYGLATLVAYLLAPIWWLGSATTAYATAKLVLVLAMTATLFPAYALARLVVSPWYALAAATCATVVPALAYSPILVEEPLAYPLSTLALWLIARVLVEPSWRRVAVALAASGAAAWTRTQLSVLFAVLALGLLFLAWDSEAARRWRSSWSRWDWAGAVVLAIGAVLAFSAAMGHASKSWRDTTGFYKDRIFDHSVEAVGALTIGIGIVPVVIGIAALARPKGESSDARTRAFVVTSIAAIAAFVWYAGIKGAYVSTVFATVVAERNVIYLGPIFFAATALAIDRGIGRGWAIAGAAVFTLYVVATTPLQLDKYPYYEAHGLSIAAFANRELGWPEGRIENTLIVVCVLALAFAVGIRVLERGSGAYRVVVGTVAALVFVWTLTAEVYAASSERDLSNMFATNFPKPYDWVDQATGGGSVVVLGQQISDPTNIQLTEFFNPSVRKMWSLDGTAINVGGPILTPDLEASDGTLTPSPETRYALALNGVELQAPVVERRKGDTLYRIDGRPIKLAAAVTGRENDGWVIGSSDDPVARASYTRYDVSRDARGFVVVKLSRLGWCPKPRGQTRATVRIGTVGIGPDKQPAIARTLDTRRVVVMDCSTTGVAFGTPTEPWRVEVAIAPTVSPHDVSPTSSERRRLGATMSVELEPFNPR
jgi:hypothetical protein